MDFNKNTKDLIKAFKIDSYVVYSKFSAKVLIEILEKNDLLNMALQQKVFCLSESIQLIMKQKGFKQLYFATSPDEAAMINVVKKSH